MPRHLRRWARRNNPECVTYHRSSRNRMSPSAMDSENLRLSSFKSYNLLRGTSPHTALARRMFDRATLEVLFILCLTLSICLVLSNVKCFLDFLRTFEITFGREDVKKRRKRSARGAPG